MSSIIDKMLIGNVEVNGRIVMPPMGTYKCDDDGFVTDEVIDYYSQRAKNPHIGLIITEHTYIDKRGKQKANQMGIDSDDKIEGLKKIVDAVLAEGKKIFAQLNFAGAASLRVVTGSEPLAPSAVMLPPTTPKLGDDVPPKEMSKDEIASVVEKFAEAAVRAKKIGYDGVEIHSAHSYLLNQFYSPLTNHRQDEYGGTIENRLRIHREVIRAVRNAVGDYYPISLRLGGYDDMDGGNTIDDAVEAAKILVAEGIDLLSLSGGMCRYIRKGHNEAGYFSDMSVAIRKVVNVPVLLTGGVKTLDDAQKLIDEDKTDFVGVGRPLLAKANWMM